MKQMYKLTLNMYVDFFLNIDIRKIFLNPTSKNSQF